jgi:hypothetical protein
VIHAFRVLESSGTRTRTGALRWTAALSYVNAEDRREGSERAGTPTSFQVGLVKVVSMTTMSEDTHIYELTINTPSSEMTSEAWQSDSSRVSPLSETDGVHCVEIRNDGGRKGAPIDRDVNLVSSPIVLNLLFSPICFLCSEDERRTDNAHTIKRHLLWPFLPLTNPSLDARAWYHIDWSR